MQTCTKCGKPLTDRTQEKPESYLVQEWRGASGSGWLITPQLAYKPESGAVIGSCCAECMARTIDSLMDDVFG